jgi:hypothetical protein
MTRIFSDGHYSYYINERDHNPPHVHIRYKSSCEARITFEGVILSNTGFKNRELKAFCRVLKTRKDQLKRKWDEQNPKR